MGSKSLRAVWEMTERVKIKNWKGQWEKPGGERERKNTAKKEEG